MCDTVNKENNNGSGRCRKSGTGNEDAVAEITSANWHITSRCNYSCKFCYAAHRSREVDSEAEIDRILAHANYIGIKKMSFVGGEPLFHEKLPYMLKTTKYLGMTSSIVTNGAFLNEDMLSKIGDDLDWVGISIDSADESVEKCLRRGFGNHVANAVKVADMVKSAGIKLKINTTVTKMSYDEDMTELIHSINPDRWKVFQYLHIKGQNDIFFDEMNITSEEFQMFISNNKSVIESGIPTVFEDNMCMLGTYLMILPNGKVIDNREGEYHKSKHFCELSKDDLQKIVDAERFEARGARYFEAM